MVDVVGRFEMHAEAMACVRGLLSRGVSASLTNTYSECGWYGTPDQTGTGKFAVTVAQLDFARKWAWCVGWCRELVDAVG